VIAKISGKLVTVTEDHAWVELHGITYSVMITRAVAQRLTAGGHVGGDVSFFTYSYIEGGMGVGNLIPRLVGFLNESDLEFFALLTSVPGFSIKRSLKALAIPVKELARAIELNDLGALKKLPEVGGKTAQKIIIELKGKVAKFALLREEDIPELQAVSGGGAEYLREAVEILKQLQYSEGEAESIVHRISTARPDIDSAEELIQEVFRRQASPQ